MKDSMSGFDIRAVTLELERSIKGKRIDNVYQLSERLFLLRLRPDRQDLIAELGRRLHSTGFQVQTPQSPTNFCSALRKRIVGAKLDKVSQLGFDRVVQFDLEKEGHGWRLIVELFGKGNMILLNPSGTIELAEKFYEARDRSVRKGREYAQAPSGLDPFKVGRGELDAIRKYGDVEVVKAITRLLSIGGVYAEEILERAKIPKAIACSHLQAPDLDRIYESTKSLCQQFQEALKPTIVFKGDEAIDLTPIRLNVYKNLKQSDFPTFNEVADEFFTRIAFKAPEPIEIRAHERKLREVTKILAMQEAKLKEFEETSKRYRDVGDTIYANFNELRELIRLFKVHGKDILEESSRATSSRRTPLAYVKDFDASSRTISLAIAGVTFNLNLNADLSKQASQYYEKGKKAKEKLAGLKASMEELRRKLAKLQSSAPEPITPSPPKLRRQKEWYEKFHWFKSSTGFLVLIGRDASTNELLIKRHTEPGDMVLHADIQGAPFVVVKAVSKQLDEQTVQEAAKAAASYSKAWALDLPAVDVYAVRPDQLSKTAPTGEHIPRGAFTISGSRRIIRGVELGLAVGIDSDLRVLGGPAAAIQGQAKAYVRIAPGRTPSGKLAKDIVKTLSGKFEMKAKSFRKIAITEIQDFIPAGRGELS